MTDKQLEALYQQYYRELFAYAYSLCQNHYTAQDLVSDTFFKALLSLEDTSYFKFWLFRVCKNIYLDELRKNRLVKEELDERRISHDTSPLEQVIESEERRILYQKILTLHPNYREVLVLYYFSGFSLEEIAQSMNQSYTATKTMLFRARRKLKLVLEES